MSAAAYRAYGFVVFSDLELPELLPADNARPVAPGDLARRPARVEWGTVPDRLEDEVRLAPWLSFAGERWLVVMDEVGRMLIEGGDRIVVQLRDGARESDLRTYIFGTGMATLLLQRGLLPLHVSALLGPDGAIAFTGPSGAGKSTAAAGLHKALGWPIVTDDVAVLTEKDGQVYIEGGVCRLRLWSDAMERLNWTTEGLARDVHRYDKFLVEDRAPFVFGPQRLSTLYEIAPDASGPPEQLAGAQRFEVLMNAIHRPFIAGYVIDPGRLRIEAMALCRLFDCVRGPRPAAETVRPLVAG